LPAIGSSPREVPHVSSNSSKIELIRAPEPDLGRTPWLRSSTERTSAGLRTMAPGLRPRGGGRAGMGVSPIASCTPATALRGVPVCAKVSGGTCRCSCSDVQAASAAIEVEIHLQPLAIPVDLHAVDVRRTLAPGGQHLLVQRGEAGDGESRSVISGLGEGGRMPMVSTRAPTLSACFSISPACRGRWLLHSAQERAGGRFSSTFQRPQPDCSSGESIASQPATLPHRRVEVWSTS